jgi:hypothetical protein
MSVTYCSERVPGNETSGGWSRGAALASGAAVLLVLAAIVLALLGRGGGALLALLLVTAFVLLSVGAAVAAYQRAMSRPWPRVKPLRDEDDDW